MKKALVALLIAALFITMPGSLVHAAKAADRAETKPRQDEKSICNSGEAVLK